MANYNFNEKRTEWVDNKELPVEQTPKYKETKEKVCKILDSGKYPGLTEANFWVLKNKYGTKMLYSGLIISHDGMKIINDNTEDKVKPQYFSDPKMSEYDGKTMYMKYQDDTTIEYGEISMTNCKQAYPYAMLFKRTFDRAVKDKAKLYGVYSEEEADDFKQNMSDLNVDKETGEVKDEPTTKAPGNGSKSAEKATDKQIETIESMCNDDEIEMMKAKYKIEELSELPKSLASQIISVCMEKKHGNHK